MSSYLTYYLGWMLLAYAVQQPILLVGIVVFLALRRYIPDPSALLRGMRRARALRHQVSLNPANVTARRDLATLYLDLRRPRAALALVEQALARDPDDAELLFLAGRALQRAGRDAEALAPLVRAVELRPKLRYGEPYMVAGDALLALGRSDEAIDAYERYARINHSDVGVHVQLARAHARASDRDAVRASLAKAAETWAHIPWSLRRRALGRWVEAHWLRARLLGDPRVIVGAAVIAAAIVVGVRVAAPHLKSTFAASSPLRGLLGANGPDGEEGLLAAYARCGSQSTGDLAGTYDVELDPDPPPPPGITEARKNAYARAHAFTEAQYRNFRIGPDRIRSGTDLVQELCLTRTLERTPTRLRAEAVWHEDVNDPGDASVVEILLERRGDDVRFTLGGSDGPPPSTVTLRRTKP